MDCFYVLVELVFRLEGVKYIFSGHLTPYVQNVMSDKLTQNENNTSSTV